MLEGFHPQLADTDSILVPRIGVPTLVLVVRAFYLVCTIAILTARLRPSLRRRFLSYGARAHHARKSKDAAGPRALSKLLDELSSISVPHRHFTHFYVLSLASSSYWMLSLWRIPVVDQFAVQSQWSALLCVSLMMIQSLRRLLECIHFSKDSTSSMWIGHYIFGLCFYFFTNIAAWVETNSPGYLSSTPAVTSSRDSSLRTGIGLVIFSLASYVQYTTHAHLASLRKYSVPDHWAFKRLVAPHYTAECAIYLSLAVIGASSSCTLNRSLLCVLVLTAVNLGITAEGTRLWMLEKFKEQHIDIEGRWHLIPGLW